MCCGDTIVNMLQVNNLAPKNRTITSLRGTAFKNEQGGVYMVTYDPTATTNKPDYGPLIDWDLRLAVRLLRTGSLTPPLGHYEWVGDFAPMIAEIEAQYEKTGKPVKASTDTETMTFHPWYPQNDIISISFSHKVGVSKVLYTGPQPPPVATTSPDLFKQISWLLNSPKVSLRLANGKFDMIWIAEKWGIECTNFKFDTLLVGSLLNENRSNSLNLHAKVFTTIGGYDDSFNKKFDKGKMETIAPADLLTYAGGDTDACLQTAEVLQEQLLEDPQLARFYVNILHPAARSFEKIERRGILVDPQKYAVLRDDLTKEVAQLEKDTLSILPNIMKAKHRDKIGEQFEAGKSPLTPSILKEFFFGPNGLNLKPLMFTGKTKEPSTARAHLKMFATNPKASIMITKLEQLSSCSKTLSTFVDGFMDCIRPDGRLHPSYMLYHGGFNDDAEDESGTVSGRLAAKDPAIQTLPSKTKWAKRLRECFPAPKGKAILVIDYSQGELRVVACVAPEKTMIESYKKGLDLHAVTGAQLAQTPIEEFLKWKDNEDKALAELFDLNRAKAKPANFGLLYGMGAAGFQAYAWANYGLALTLAEAETMRNAFFALYPGLTDYHETMRAFVKMHEMVRSPLGRIRHLPHIRAWDNETKSRAERQAINSPIQSTLTDMLIWSIARIEDAYPNGEIEVVAMIHDAFYAYVDEDKVPLRFKQAQEIMTNLPLKSLGWNPVLDFPVDGTWGYNLSEKNKIKLAA